ncbi:helix-turn-helix transcriptional regulator, partial [Bradyrhizobium sp. 24]|nr:helix-turn-helix transcriptional regulator [Bradyrhizobium sp. 24]
FHFPGRPPLTVREREVLSELIGGRSTKEIADRMDLSPRTIESHRVNIMQKVGAKNPAELVRLA